MRNQFAAEPLIRSAMAEATLSATPVEEEAEPDLARHLRHEELSCHIGREKRSWDAGARPLHGDGHPKQIGRRRPEPGSRHLG
jgi:hypothetical protein